MPAFFIPSLKRQIPMADSAEKARTVQPITMDRVSQAAATIMDFRVVTPPGVEPDDLVNVAYWTHFAALLKDAQRQGDVFLSAFSEDNRWYARYLLRAAGDNWARVQMLEKHVLDVVDPRMKIAILAGYTINHGGKIAKWRVVRDADQETIRGKFETESEAYAWLVEWSRSVDVKSAAA